MSKLTITLVAIALLVVATEQRSLEDEIELNIKQKEMSPEQLEDMLKQLKQNSSGSKTLVRNFRKGRRGNSNGGSRGRPGQQSQRGNRFQKIDCTSPEPLATIILKRNSSSRCKRAENFKAKIEAVLAGLSNQQRAQMIRDFFQNLTAVKENVSFTAFQNVETSQTALFDSLTLEQVSLLDQMAAPGLTCFEKEQLYSDFAQLDELTAAQITCFHRQEAAKLSKITIRKFFKNKRNVLKAIFTDPEARKLSKMLRKAMKF